MKPSFGRINTEGILPFAPSLDHPGPIARCVSDLQLLFEVIRDPASMPGACPPPAAGVGPPRLGRLGGYFDRRASVESRRIIQQFVNSCQKRGAATTDVGEPVDFEAILRSHRAIMAREAAIVHGDRLSSAPEAYPPRITELVREGKTVPGSDYHAARERKIGMVDAMLKAFVGLDALVTPATIGPAPDPSTTGDPAFNSPWSYLGFPTASFPIGFSAGGLPVAVQLIGRPGDDMGLLRTASWCESVTRSAQ
jgi:aspartyl-tRNA(Asn)/glutamyl-tRNA(Gln) amidotransferase subunit A